MKNTEEYTLRILVLNRDGEVIVDRASLEEEFFIKVGDSVTRFKDTQWEVVKIIDIPNFSSKGLSS